MRETDFRVNTRPTGRMSFRTLLPVVSGELWDYKPAASPDEASDGAASLTAAPPQR